MVNEAMNVQLAGEVKARFSSGLVISRKAIAVSVRMFSTKIRGSVVLNGLSLKVSINLILANCAVIGEVKYSSMSRSMSINLSMSWTGTAADFVIVLIVSVKASSNRSRVLSSLDCEVMMESDRTTAIHYFAKLL